MVSFNDCSVLPIITTFAPFLEARMAVALPIPLPPPVITTFLFLRRSDSPKV